MFSYLNHARFQAWEMANLCFLGNGPSVKKHLFSTYMISLQYVKEIGIHKKNQTCSLVSGFWSLPGLCNQEPFITCIIIIL